MTFGLKRVLRPAAALLAAGVLFTALPTAAAEAATMIVEITCVTIEPPTLSAIQPPTGRIAAPTKGPIHA